MFDSPRSDLMLNAILVLAVVLAVGSVAYVSTTTHEYESYTEFYLLAENDSGEIVAENYPRSFDSGEGEDLVVGVTNHERFETNYTIVILLEVVDRSDDSMTVRDRERLATYRTGTLSHNETRLLEHEVRPTMSGENLRLTYLLYRGAPPNEPVPENAYRSLHLWIDVRDESQ